MMKKGKYVLLIWSEVAEMWYRYRQAPTYNTRRHLTLWAKNNIKNQAYIVVPDEPVILKEMEGDREYEIPINAHLR